MNHDCATSDAEDQGRLSRSAPWVVVCRVVGILATLAGNILAARVLGRAEFGLYLFLTTVAAFGSLLGMAGMNDAALRFLSENLALGQRDRAVAYVRRITGLCLAACMVAAVLVLAGLTGFQLATGRFSQPALLIGLTVVALVALAWQQLAGEILRGWNELRLASLFSGGVTGGPISNVLFLAVIGGLWITNTSVGATGGLGLLAASVCVTVPAALYCVWKTVHRSGLANHGQSPAVLSAIDVRQLMTVALTLLVLQLLAFASQQLDIWIGEGVLPPEDLGLYGVAKRTMLMVAMPVQMVVLAIASSIPRMQAQNRRNELQHLLRNSAGLAAIPSLAALAALVIFPETILTMIWGGSYAGAALLVRILAIGNVALIVLGNPVHALALTGHHNRALAVNLVAALVMAVGGPLLALRFGAAGLAASSAAALAIQNLLLWIFARRDLGVWTHASVPRRAIVNSPTIAECRAAVVADATLT